MNELCERVRNQYFKVMLDNFFVALRAGRSEPKEIFVFSHKYSQFPMDLAVLAFPCNQFGHQENATNQVIVYY